MREAVEVARLLQPHRVAVELDRLRRPAEHGRCSIEAVAEGVLEWRDFMPNDEALKRLDGALAGLSLLHDEPNYRHSMPTKIVEYMAHGIPVITTPSPRAVELVERYESGWSCPGGPAGGGAGGAAAAQRRGGAAGPGARGYAAARANHHWPNSARRFVTQLEAWAGVKR